MPWHPPGFFPARREADADSIRVLRRRFLEALPRGGLSKSLILPTRSAYGRLQSPKGFAPCSGRVPPCTGPRQAGLPKQAFKTVLLMASLPRKGMDKEAGRSARAPAPEVALLLPAQARSGAPLRTRGAPRGHPLLCLSAAASPTPVYSSEAALSPPNPLSPCSCLRMPREEGVQGKGHSVRASADGWLRKGEGREGRAPHTPSGLA